MVPVTASDREPGTGHGDDLDDPALDDFDGSHAAPPSAGTTSRSRFGCLGAAFIFLAFAILGFTVAASIRGNDDDRTRFTLQEGTESGVSYELVGEIDEQGARCLLLLRQDELNTGACDDESASEGRVGDRSVIFGQVPSRAESVRIPLTNGDRATTEVREQDGFRWYYIVVPENIDVKDNPTFIDADGGSI